MGFNCRALLAQWRLCLIHLKWCHLVIKSLFLWVDPNWQGCYYAIENHWNCDIFVYFWHTFGIFTCPRKKIRIDMNIKSSPTMVPGMRARCDGMPSLGRTSAPVAVAERPRWGEHVAPCTVNQWPATMAILVIIVLCWASQVTVLLNGLIFL